MASFVSMKCVVQAQVDEQNLQRDETLRNADAIAALPQYTFNNHAILVLLSLCLKQTAV